MVKFILFIIIIGLFLIPLSSSIGSDFEIINGRQIINDSRVYISAPYEVTSSGNIVVELQSKQFTGNISIAFGFDTEQAKPKSPEWYNPKIITDVNGTNRTKEWWAIGNKKFKRIDYEFDDKDIWYVRKNHPVVAGETYKIRFYLELPDCIIGKNGYNDCVQKGKYDIAIMPSSMTISEAIAQDKFYFLDPTWYLRYMINATGVDSGNITFHDPPNHDATKLNDGAWTTNNFLADACVSIAATDNVWVGLQLDGNYTMSDIILKWVNDYSAGDYHWTFEVWYSSGGVETLVATENTNPTTGKAYLYDTTDFGTSAVADLIYMVSYNYTGDGNRFGYAELWLNGTLYEAPPPPVYYFQNLSESISVLDSIDKEGDFFRAREVSFVVSDEFTKLAEYQRTIKRPFSINDFLGKSSSFFRWVSETFSILTWLFKSYAAIEPVVIIHSPEEDKYYFEEEYILLNATAANISILDTWWYTTDNGLSNTSFTPPKNILLSERASQYTLSVYVNETTGGATGYDSVSFFVISKHDAYFWLYVAVFVMVCFFMILGYGTDDHTFGLFGGMLLCAFGISLAIEGFPFFDNAFLETGVYLSMLGVGFYLIVASGLRLIRGGRE